MSNHTAAHVVSGRRPCSRAGRRCQRCGRVPPPGGTARGAGSAKPGPALLRYRPGNARPYAGRQGSAEPHGDTAGVLRSIHGLHTYGIPAQRHPRHTAVRCHPGTGRCRYGVRQPLILCGQPLAGNGWPICAGLGLPAGCRTNRANALTIPAKEPTPLRATSPNAATPHEPPPSGSRMAAKATKPAPSPRTASGSLPSRITIPSTPIRHA